MQFIFDSLKSPLRIQKINPADHSAGSGIRIN